MLSTSAEQAASQTLFQADFEAAVQEAPSTGVNVNLGVAIGDISDYNDGSPGGIQPDDAGGRLLEVDRRNAAIDPLRPGYDFFANLSQPASLAGGVTFSCEYGFGRGGVAGGTLFKHVNITGLDASDNVGFHIRHYIDTAGSTTVPAIPAVTNFWETSTDGSTFVFASPTNPGPLVNYEEHERLVGPGGEVALMVTLTVNMTGAGYTFNFGGSTFLDATPPVAAYTTGVITYQSAVTQITKIRFLGMDESGSYFDNILVETGSGVSDWREAFLPRDSADPAQGILSSLNLGKSFMPEEFASAR